MRLCFVCQEDIVKPQGGTGTYVRNVSMYMAARGHDVHVIVRQRDQAAIVERVAGVMVHRVPAPGPPVLYSPLYFQQARRKFLKLNSEKRFDAIQGNMPLMSSWGLQLAGLPPVVETVHCTVEEEIKSINRTSLGRLNLNEVLARFLAPVWLHRERYLLERARQVIAVSNGLKRELVRRDGFRGERVSVIPNGIDYRRFAVPREANRAAVRQRLGIGVDEPVILYLGRLMERKRAIDLVRALPAVHQRLPNARLVIVGKRNPNALRIEQTARELGVEARVSLVDHVPYQDVPAYYAMADVYALPSAYEGFPFTILEAMAAGTPVIASNIPGIDEQIVPYETGLLHQVGDVSMIARHIVSILEDRNRALALTTNARRVVEQYFNWEVIGLQTERVFEQVIMS